MLECSGASNVHCLRLLNEPIRWLIPSLGGSLVAFPNFWERIILSISGSLDKDNRGSGPPRRLAIRGSVHTSAARSARRADGARWGAICSVSSALFGACVARARLDERNLSGCFTAHFNPGTRNSPQCVGHMYVCAWRVLGVYECGYGCALCARVTADARDISRGPGLRNSPSCVCVFCVVC